MQVILRNILCIGFSQAFDLSSISCFRGVSFLGRLFGVFGINYVTTEIERVINNTTPFSISTLSVMIFLGGKEIAESIFDHFWATGTESFYRFFLRGKNCLPKIGSRPQLFGTACGDNCGQFQPPSFCFWVETYLEKLVFAFKSGLIFVRNGISSSWPPCSFNVLQFHGWKTEL